MASNSALYPMRRNQYVSSVTYPLSSSKIAQWAGAVEYTYCTSAEGVRPPQKCPGYDTKQSDGEVSIMLKLWGMQSTPLLPSISGPLMLGVAAPNRVLWIK